MPFMRDTPPVCTVELFKNVRTIDCKGKRVESFGNHCSSRGSNPGCASSYDVCYVKSGTHSQCRPVDRMLPTCWDAIEVVKCRALLHLLPFHAVSCSVLEE